MKVSVYIKLKYRVYTEVLSYFFHYMLQLMPIKSIETHNDSIFAKVPERHKKAHRLMRLTWIVQDWLR